MPRGWSSWYTLRMDKDVVDYASAATSDHGRPNRGPIAAAIRLVALAIMFLAGAVLLTGGLLVGPRSTSIDLAPVVAWLGFGAMVISGVSFGLSFFDAGKS